jgi:hypothetical protein
MILAVPFAAEHDRVTALREAFPESRPEAPGADDPELHGWSLLGLAEVTRNSVDLHESMGNTYRVSLYTACV